MNTYQASSMGPWQGPAFLNLSLLLSKENTVLCSLMIDKMKMMVGGHNGHDDGDDGGW